MHKLPTYMLELFCLTKISQLFHHAKRNSAGTFTQVGQMKCQVPSRKEMQKVIPRWLRFPYLVCGPELCVCATRTGVTSRLFPLCEKTDFVPAWLILLTVCITQSFYRFVITSLRSLNLCYINPKPFCLSNTVQRRTNLCYFNKGWQFHPKEDP